MWVPNGERKLAHQYLGKDTRNTAFLCFRGALGRCGVSD
jgi:hypothetical protein